MKNKTWIILTIVVVGILALILFLPSRTGAYWNRADINGDGIVNEADKTILSDNWDKKCCEPVWCEGADINRDGVVDLIDLGRLGLNWGAVKPVPVVKSTPSSTYTGGGLNHESRARWMLTNPELDPLKRLELQLQLIKIEIGKLLKEIREFLG